MFSIISEFDELLAISSVWLDLQADMLLGILSEISVADVDVDELRHKSILSSNSASDMLRDYDTKQKAYTLSLHNWLLC